MSDATEQEPTYADRTDDVDTKVEILRRALRAGDHELALGVADSIKDTVVNRRRLEADPGPVDLPATGWRSTGELPQAWARWADGWSLFQALRLTEPVGQARQAEPLDLIVGMPADRVASPGRELRVAHLDGGYPQEIRSQVYGELRRGPYWLAHLVFEADVEADGEAVFLVFCGNPAAELPDYPSRLTVGGQGVDLEIENPHYIATLSSRMGQLEALTPKWHNGGLRLSTHGNGHGEPPNLDWAHDYTTAGAFQKMRMTNWSECPNYEVVRGPVCAIVRRFGFPHSPVHPLFTPSRLFMDLSYTFYAGAPTFSSMAGCGQREISLRWWPETTSGTSAAGPSTRLCGWTRPAACRRARFHLSRSTTSGARASSTGRVGTACLSSTWTIGSKRPPTPAPRQRRERPSTSTSISLSTTPHPARARTLRSGAVPCCATAPGSEPA